MSRKVLSSWVSCGSCMALMASTFSGLGFTPSASRNMPNHVILVSLIWHLSKLKTSPCCRATNIKLCKLSSCSFSVGPCIANVICNTNCSRAFLNDNVHLPLENILANAQSERKTGKSESLKWAVEDCKVTRLFSKLDARHGYW